MCLPLLQIGKNHRFQVPAQFVAVDRFHAFILDRLGIKSTGVVPRFFRPSDPHCEFVFGLRKDG